MTVHYDFDLHACVAAQLASHGLRMDANETAAFTRELEYVHAEVIEAKYPAYKWRDVVPIKGGIPPGVTSHRWYEIDGYGSAQFLDNFAVEDFPTVEVKGAENTEKIRSMGAKYGYSVEDLRAASRMRVNVDAEKAKLVRRGIEARFDIAVWGAFGTKFGGFKGLIHNDNSTAYTPHATLGSNGSWADATTPAKLIHDVRGMLDAAFIETKGEFPLYDLLLPPELSVKLEAPMSFTDGGNTRYTDVSIAKYMLANITRLRSIKLDCNRLTDAGTSGAGYHRALAYPREPEVLDAVVPLEFEQFAPQLSGMSFETYCHAKYGGLRIKHVKAIRRMDLTV